jgi:hypothetical protein
MEAHQFGDEGEADTGTLVGPASRPLDPLEALEQPRLVRRRDADARVGHGELDGIAGAPQGDAQ